MDKKQVKLRINPEVIAKLKFLHPSYGEMSRIVGELVEDYIKHRTNQETLRKASTNG